MGVQLVHHQHYTLGLPIAPLEQIADEAGPLAAPALRRHGHIPPALERLAGQEQVGHAMRGSLHPAPPGASSALSRMWACLSLRRSALPRASSCFSLSRSSASSVTRYRLFMVGLLAVRNPRQQQRSTHHFSLDCALEPFPPRPGGAPPSACRSFGPVRLGGGHRA